MNHVKVAITGAAGQIGYQLIFRIASGQMFGPNTKVDLHLLELEAALPGLQGVAMELDDCAFPLLNRVVCTSELKTAMDGVNWAVLVGAIPRKAGMERSDLLTMNGKIFVSQGRAINDYAAKDVRVFVVGNPCNTNCLIAMHNAPDVPRDRFFAMTALDENRARGQLAIKAGVSVADVSQMVIWGNHSATQFPDYINAKIQGKPVLEVIKDENWLQNEFIPCVQNRGAAVIKARGASSAASAANAAIDGVYRLIHDTPAHEIHGTAMCTTGEEYGLPKDLIYSLPYKIQQGKLIRVLDVKHNAFAQQKMKVTLDDLMEEYKAVKDLKLI